MMATAQLESVKRLFKQVRTESGHDSGDGELLRRWNRERDEFAFAALVQRHGGLVLGVCKRVLRDVHAAEDAFQATFLVLAKKANVVRPPGVLGPWLYGVAYRTALKARGRTFRRLEVEQDYAEQKRGEFVPVQQEANDLLPIIDEQLNALPEKYRHPLVLCGVQGLGKAEAAERLGVPEGTVSSRLARGREMLRDRLSRRGIIVPLAAIIAFLKPSAAHAAVSPAVSNSVAEIAAGLAPVSPDVLALSHEVLNAMTLVKWKFLSAVTVAALLTGGGFGLVASNADDKKPQPAPETVKKPQPVPDGIKKPQPNADDPKKPQPAPDGVKKPAPDQPKPGEKPAKPGADKGGAKFAGTVASVDAKENTITLNTKGDKGLAEKVIKLTADAKVIIDDKPGSLKDVPKGASATLLGPVTKEGQPAEASEVRISGQSVTGTVTKADASSVSVEVPSKEGATVKTFKVTADTKIYIGSKEPSKAADLKVGEKVVVVASTDGASAVSIGGGFKPDGEKPDKTKTAPKLGGKVASVDAKERTITLTTKGDAAGMVVKVTADAKVTIDGKDAKLADVAKGMSVTFTIASAKDGQPREASEVIATGPTFAGLIRQIDAAAITVGTEKADRTFKLTSASKVVINGKDAKLADLKAGDKVAVTLSADESTAMSIVMGEKVGGDKPVKPGDKTKPDGDDEEDN
jgi:RNA polymerase sigma factor (sigma-70 family)